MEVLVTTQLLSCSCPDESYSICFSIMTTRKVSTWYFRPHLSEKETLGVRVAQWWSGCVVLIGLGLLTRPLKQKTKQSQTTHALHSFCFCDKKRLWPRVCSYSHPASAISESLSWVCVSFCKGKPLASAQGQGTILPP